MPPLVSNESAGRFALGLRPRIESRCGGKADGDYNLPLHVIALFVVLVQSILSCSFPLIVKRFPQLRIPHHFFFGTGVLIATAFVHLLPTAFTSLTEPCLPPFWNQGYPAMAGLIAMASVFFVVVVEMSFSVMNGGAIGGCHGGSVTGYDSLAPMNPEPDHNYHSGEEDYGDGVLASVRPGHRRSASIGSQLQRFDHDDGVPRSSTERLIATMEGGEDEATSILSGSGESTELETLRGNGRKQPQAAAKYSNAVVSRLTEEQQQKKNLLQVMLLEAGILFHSVFIGMALSVATGSNFMVLFIAIVFHQTFEGLALGSRIASIAAFAKGSAKPWLMCLAYGTTTPIGQAIGLATRKLYDPQSETGLIMVGIMNAISSGLLLFAGLVELLAEDFLSDESYIVLQGRRRLEACIAVGLGAFGMALIGAWA